MSATALIDSLKARGIMLRAVGNQIQAKPISDVLLEDRKQLKQFKVELLKLLRAEELPDEFLIHNERRQLMTETADRLCHNYHGQFIDWNRVSAINARIGETFSRRELVKLLQQYEAAVDGRTCG